MLFAPESPGTAVQKNSNGLSLLRLLRLGVTPATHHLWPFGDLGDRVHKVHASALAYQMIMIDRRTTLISHVCYAIPATPVAAFQLRRLGFS